LCPTLPRMFATCARGIWTYGPTSATIPLIIQELERWRYQQNPFWLRPPSYRPMSALVERLGRPRSTLSGRVRRLVLVTFGPRGIHQRRAADPCRSRGADRVRATAIAARRRTPQHYGPQFWSVTCVQRLLRAGPLRLAAEWHP